MSLSHVYKNIALAKLREKKAFNDLVSYLDQKGFSKEEIVSFLEEQLAEYRAALFEVHESDDEIAGIDDYDLTTDQDAIYLMFDSGVTVSVNDEGVITAVNNNLVN